MPLTDEFIPFHVRLCPGQDTKNRDTLLEVQKVETAKNLRYDTEVGSVVKRRPLAYYNATTLGANPVHSLKRFYTRSSKFLLAGYQGTFKVGTDSTGTFADLKTGMTSDKRYSFVTYKDLCIFSNGFDNVMATDGAAAWELGACKATLAAGGTNLDSGAVYYYAITMDTDAYVCGAISNSITTDGSNRRVSLSNIPLGPVGTANRRVYRVEGGGSTLKLVATISDNTTTTYSDDTADGSLGADMPAVTDDFPKGRYLQLYRERLLIAHNDDNPSRIYYSNPFLPWYIQQTSNADYVDVAPDDGDVITGIPIQLGTVNVFKRNTIRKWHTDSADPDNWLVDDPISYQGCPAPYSIAQTPYGVVYQGWDHMYLFNGAVSQPIIDEFDIKEDIKKDSIADSVGFWHDNVYLLSYVSSEGGSDYQDRVMRFHWLRSAVSIDTINVASFTAYKGDDERGDLYYGDSQNGFVYLSENYEQQIALQTKSQLNGNLSYPDNIFSGLDDIYLGGSEEDPTLEIGWDVTINNAVGTINSGYSGTATIDRPDTTGTYTSEVFEINAAALGKIYWNEMLPSGCDVQVHTRTGSTVSATEAASWSAALTNPNGSTIASTANIYFQFKMELTSGSVSTTPTVSSGNGYVVRFTYTPGGTEVSDDIPFTYGTGFRNFGAPHQDKIYKKVVLLHDGTEGSVTVTWETDLGHTGSWTIPLATYPKRWEAFFPPNAYGRQVKFTMRKTDVNNYRIKEILGLWSPMPTLL